MMLMFKLPLRVETRSIRRFSGTILWHSKIRWSVPLDFRARVDSGRRAGCDGQRLVFRVSTTVLWSATRSDSKSMACRCCCRTFELAFGHAGRLVSSGSWVSCWTVAFWTWTLTLWMRMRKLIYSVERLIHPETIAVGHNINAQANGICALNWLSNKTPQHISREPTLNWSL